MESELTDLLKYILFGLLFTSWSKGVSTEVRLPDHFSILVPPFHDSQGHHHRRDVGMEGDREQVHFNPRYAIPPSRLSPPPKEFSVLFEKPANGESADGHNHISPQLNHRADSNEDIRMHPLPPSHHKSSMMESPAEDRIGPSICSIFKTFLGPRRNRCVVSRPGINPHHPSSNRLLRSPALQHRMMEHRFQGSMGRPLTFQSNHGGFLRYGEPRRQEQREESDGSGTVLNHSGEQEEEFHHSRFGQRDERHLHQMMDSFESDSDNDIPDDDGPRHHHERHESDIPKSPRPMNMMAMLMMMMTGGTMDTPPMDPSKTSQSRSMILVPERGCPSGERRDVRGFCRKAVRIRTSYQYGPPPLPPSYHQQTQQHSRSFKGNKGNVVRQIPIRYYYSRVVSIPTFQLLIPPNG